MDIKSEKDRSIRAVIFDLGGVILRTDDPNPRRLLAKKMRRTFTELDEIVFGNPVAQKAERGQATPEQVWAEIAKLLQLSEAKVANFRREFFAGDKVDIELVELIAKIRQNYRTGLLSNTWIRDLEQFIFYELKMPKVFDAVISSARSGFAKPDSEIYCLALNALDVAAEEAIFVDDNQANIQAANRLGICAIHFKNTTNLRQELAKHLQLTEVKRN